MKIHEIEKVAAWLIGGSISERIDKSVLVASATSGFLLLVCAVLSRISISSTIITLDRWEYIITLVLGATLLVAAALMRLVAAKFRTQSFKALAEAEAESRARLAQQQEKVQGAPE